MFKSNKNNNDDNTAAHIDAVMTGIKARTDQILAERADAARLINQALGNSGDQNKR
ncbi:hypothetical protein ACWGIB_27415 [Streptomyces xiamenensis]